MVRNVFEATCAVSEQELESHCMGPPIVAFLSSTMRPRLEQLLSLDPRMKTREPTTES